MRRSVVLTGSRLAALVILLAAVVLAVAAAINHQVKAAETQAAVDSMTKESNQVTAVELAQWIVEKRQDYQLMDLREPWQFDDYHIPTAINVPFAQVLGPGARLDKSKKIVVYGLGAGQAAQMQLLLTMKGYRAYALNDGIIAWWDEVMTPISIRSGHPQSSGYQQARQLREYFMTGAPASQPPSAVIAPAAEAPAAPAPPAPAKVGKKAVSKPAAPPAAKPTAQPAAKPAAKPAEAPPPDKEKDRLKLGTGCS